MLVSKTSAAAFPLTCFRGLARVPQKRACVPTLARVPEVARPCSILQAHQALALPPLM